jgi:hypothetical protein
MGPVISDRTWQIIADVSGTPKGIGSVARVRYESLFRWTFCSLGSAHLTLLASLSSIQLGAAILQSFFPSFVYFLPVPERTYAFSLFFFSLFSSSIFYGSTLGPISTFISWFYFFGLFLFFLFIVWIFSVFFQFPFLCYYFVFIYHFLHHSLCHKVLMYLAE